MNLTLLDGAIMAGLLVGILGLMAGVRLLRKRYELSAEVQRKLVHVATGGAALTFPWIFSSAIPVLILVGIASAIMLLMRQSKIAMNSIGAVLHDVQRNSYGEIYLVLSVGLLFIRSTDAPVLYVLPLLVVTLSDTASALVGTKYGQARFAVVEGTKSLEGVVAFFVVTWLAGMIAL
ncbi:MAG TPA: cytidylyltransferase, partial [Devosia sp.]|nr:cytidylyltransferase [Devosia sp.]